MTGPDRTGNLQPQSQSPRLWKLGEHVAGGVLIVLVVLAVLVVVVVAVLTTPQMAIATLAYVLLVAGLFVRKTHRNLHVALMGAGIAIDWTVVGVLQFQRDAVQTVIEDSLSLFQTFHAATSAVAAAFYIPTVIIGILLLARPDLKVGWLGRHRFIALTAFVFRSLGYVTMFSMLKQVPS